MLYRISGVSGKMSTETASDDDNFGTEQSHKVFTFFNVSDCKYKTVRVGLITILFRINKQIIIINY